MGVALPKEQRQSQIPGEVSRHIKFLHYYNTLYDRHTRPLDNPNYTTTNPLHLYSSQGPKDTPLNTSPTVQTSFGTYDIIRSPTQATPKPSIPTEDGIYQVLEDPKGKGPNRKDGHEADLEEERGDYYLLGEAGAEGEGDYHVLEEAGEELVYEVPVPQKDLTKAAAGKQQGTEEYSTLQYH